MKEMLHPGVLRHGGASSSLCLGGAGPLLLTRDLSCLPAPGSGLCPSTLQVGPMQVPNMQLHSPGTLSCLQLSSLCIPASSHTPGISPAACPLRPPFPPQPNPHDTCSSPEQRVSSPPCLNKAWGALNKTYAFHACNSPLPLISWQIRRD